MKYFAYKFCPEMEILVDRKYTSFVVAVVPEMQPHVEEMNLIVYKDWNPYKEIWDYHVNREIELSCVMDLLKREFEQEGSFIGSYLKEEDVKRMTDAFIPGPDGKKVTLDNEHMKEVFSHYEILKEWEFES